MQTPEQYLPTITPSPIPSPLPLILPLSGKLQQTNLQYTLRRRRQDSWASDFILSHVKSTREFASAADWNPKKWIEMEKPLPAFTSLPPASQKKYKTGYTK